MMRRAVLTLALILGMGVSAAPASVSAATTGPKHIAALGDSITRAFDVSGSYFLRDAPAESWSTGTDSKVNSHFLRLKSLNRKVVAENDAVTGSRMSALPGQMATALGHGADYVTVLMGANDVCTKTVGEMTDPGALQADFDAALKQTDGKSVRVFVASIPNVNLLYDLFQDSSSARSAWSFYGVCQDLLSSSATPEDRTAVSDRVKADNAVLEQTCAMHPTCKWDGSATYNVQFLKSDVSTVDYFHPSVAGQAKLAATTWPVSPYGG